MTNSRIIHHIPQLLGLMILAAACAYSVNTLPWISLADCGRNCWLKQAGLFGAYGLLSLSAAASCAAVDHATRRRADWKFGKRLLCGGAAMSLATGATLAAVVSPAYAYLTGSNWDYPLQMWFINSTISLCVYAALLMHRAIREQRDQALQVQLNTDALETMLDRAELSMLEAQIEPHFLFNTLAHVKRNYRVSPASADKMLAALIDYLNRAAPALRRTDWTLGDEIELVRTYLDIQTERFGDHMRYQITVPDDSLHFRIPALTIATLVENAVRHGIAPQTEGGTVWVNAKFDAAGLQIDVSDDGVGLKISSGSGLGLATVRARLRGAFGTKVEFSVAPLNDKGVRASIAIASGRL